MFCCWVIAPPLVCSISVNHKPIHPTGKKKKKNTSESAVNLITFLPRLVFLHLNIKSSSLNFWIFLKSSSFPTLSNYYWFSLFFALLSAVACCFIFKYNLNYLQQSSSWTFKLLITLNLKYFHCFLWLLVSKHFS